MKRIMIVGPLQAPVLVHEPLVRTVAADASMQLRVARGNISLVGFSFG